MRLLKYWPLLILIVATLILRIFKIEDLFYFTYDESIPAFVGRRAILWQHIPLIGGVTPFGVHLAPYFYWFLTAILFVGKLNPIAWGWAGAAISTLTTFFSYIVGSTLVNRKVGITAAIFWAFSYLANVYDRHLWALYWGPLVSLIVLFSLYKIIKGYHKFVYLLGGILALGISADPSNIVFLLLAIIVWIIYKLPLKKSTFLALGVIIFSFLPLVIFDIRHDFANTKPVIDFVKQGRNYPGFNLEKFTQNSLLFPRVFSRLIYTFSDYEISKQYSYCKDYVSEKFQAIPWYFVLLSLFTIVAIIFWSFRQQIKGSPWRLLSILVLLYFLGIQLYGTIFRADIFEHYITGLFAIFLLIFAKLVSDLPKNLWLAVLAIFIAANLIKLTAAQNSMGLKYKRQAIEYTMQVVGDRPFSLDSLSTCWKLNGYRYLFAIFGSEPGKSYVDPNFAYLYGTTPVAEKHPATVVAFVVHDFIPETEDFYRRYALLKSHEIKSAIFGAIEVIIMDNSTGWFDRS